MIRNRQKFIENELHRCETQLRTLLKPEENALTANPSFSCPSELLEKVKLAVKFDLQFKQFTANVEISNNGSVIIQTVSSFYGQLQTLTSPLNQRITYIEHFDSKITDGRNQPKKVVYDASSKQLIPDAIMRGINATTERIARNETRLTIYAFPYTIHLDFKAWDSMFP